MASLIDPPKTDPGFAVYHRNIVLDIPYRTAGRYTIGFKTDPSTFATDADSNDIPVIVNPVIIEIPGRLLRV